jgi:hypothetical protein
MDERLTAVEAAQAQHERWHEDIGARMQQFHDKLDENTRTTQEIKDSTFELLEIMTSWKGAMRVIGWLAKPLTWIASFMAACTAVYFAIWPRK